MAADADAAASALEPPVPAAVAVAAAAAAEGLPGPLDGLLWLSLDVDPDRDGSTDGLSQSDHDRPTISGRSDIVTRLCVVVCEALSCVSFFESATTQKKDFLKKENILHTKPFLKSALLLLNNSYQQMFFSKSQFAMPGCVFVHN